MPRSRARAFKLRFRTTRNPRPNVPVPNEEQPALWSGYAVGMGTPEAAVVWRNDRGSLDDAIEVIAYASYGPGGYTLVPMACIPMPITASPEPAVGQEITISSPNVQGWVVGFPRAQPVFCPGSLCSLGVDGQAVVPYPASVYRLRIPGHISFVGLTLAVQPYQLGTGLPCLGVAALGDTLQITIR